MVDLTLYYLLQTIITYRQLYDPIFTECKKWRGAVVYECNDSRARRYLEKAAALAEWYLESTGNVSIALVIYNKSGEPQEKWSFDCHKASEFDAKAFQAVTNQIVAAAGYLQPLDESFKFKVLATVPAELNLAQFNLRLSRDVLPEVSPLKLTQIPGISTIFYGI